MQLDKFFLFSVGSGGFAPPPPELNFIWVSERVTSRQRPAYSPNAYLIAFIQRAAICAGCVNVTSLPRARFRTLAHLLQMPEAVQHFVQVFHCFPKSKMPDSAGENYSSTFDIYFLHVLIRRDRKSRSEKFLHFAQIRDDCATYTRVSSDMSVILLLGMSTLLENSISKAKDGDQRSINCIISGMVRMSHTD